MMSTIRISQFVFLVGSCGDSLKLCGRVVSCGGSLEVVSRFAGTSILLDGRSASFPT